MKIKACAILASLSLLISCGKFIGFNSIPEPDLGDIKKIRVYLSAESLKKLYNTRSETEDYYTSCIYQEDGSRNEGLIKVRGLTARFFPKKNFAVKIYSGEEEIKYAFDASDEPWVTNRIVMFAYNKVGLPAPNTVGVAFFINDEYLGYYTRVDMYNEKILRQHYYGKPGELFKAFFESRDIGYDIPLHSISEKKFPADNDFSNLDTFIYNAKNMEDEEWLEWVSLFVDMDEIVKYMIVHNFFAVIDTSWLNFYIYNYGKMLILPWDNENCMDLNLVSLGGHNLLTNRLMAVPYIGSQYNSEFQRLFLDTDELIDDLIDEANRIFYEIDRAVYYDPIIYRTYEDYLREKGSVINFLNNRADKYN